MTDGESTKTSMNHGPASPETVVPRPPARRSLRGHSADRIPEILDAAATEFAESGFLGARMDDIAARIGVTKPVIYQHFRNKQALFEALMDRDIVSPTSDLAESVSQWTGPLKPLLETVTLQIARELPNSTKARNQFRLVVTESHRAPMSDARFARAGQHPLLVAVSDLFAVAMADGRMRPADPVLAGREFFAPFFESGVILLIFGPQHWEEWRGEAFMVHCFESFCRSYDITD